MQKNIVFFSVTGVLETDGDNYDQSAIKQILRIKREASAMLVPVCVERLFPHLINNLNKMLNGKIYNVFKEFSQEEGMYDAILKHIKNNKIDQWVVLIDQKIHGHRFKHKRMDGRLFFINTGLRQRVSSKIIKRLTGIDK